MSITTNNSRPTDCHMADDISKSIREKRWLSTGRTGLNEVR